MAATTNTGDGTMDATQTKPMTVLERIAAMKVEDAARAQRIQNAPAVKRSNWASKQTHKVLGY